MGRGRPETRILAIAMDRAFDARELRRDLRKRGIRSSIPERKRRGKRRQRGSRPKQYPVSKERYKIERVNAWMDTYLPGAGGEVRTHREPLPQLLPNHGDLDVPSAAIPRARSTGSTGRRSSITAAIQECLFTQAEQSRGEPHSRGERLLER